MASTITVFAHAMDSTINVFTNQSEARGSCVQGGSRGDTTLCTELNEGNNLNTELNRGNNLKGMQFNRVLRVGLSPL